MNALFIDIFCCGSDSYGRVNNPLDFACAVASDTTDGKEFLNVKFEKHFRLTGLEEPVTSSAQSSVRLREADPVETMDFMEGLKWIHSTLTKCLEKGMLLVGYNHVDYDLKILNVNFAKYRLSPVIWPASLSLDVMRLAEALLDYKNVGTYSMEAVLFELTGEYRLDDELRSSKPSLADNKLCFRLLDALVHELNKDPSRPQTRDLASLKAFMDEPRTVKEIWFGKYKGMSLYKLVREAHSYASWLIRDEEIKVKYPNLVRSIKALLQSRN